MNSLIISVFRYGCPILINCNISLIAKLQTLLMKCSRHVLGYRSYKMSTKQIMEKLGWNTVNHMIIMESIKFIHKIIFNHEPNSIFRLFESEGRDGSSLRMVKKLRVKDIPKSEKAYQTLIYRALYLYNKLDYETRSENPKQISKYLKKYIKILFSYDKIPIKDIS